MTEMRVEVSDAAPEFFADDLTVSHTPLRFILDFKSLTPRINTPKESRHMILKHSVIKVEPFIARALLEVLTSNLERYEKEYGKIKKPKALEIAERNTKKNNKINNDNKKNNNNKASPLHYVG